MSCSLRCPWRVLAWTLLLAVLLSGLIPPSSTAVDDVGCKNHTNCSSCVELFELNCTWLQCKGNLSQSHCTNDPGQHSDCTVMTHGNATCSGSPNTTTISIITTPTGSSGNGSKSLPTVSPTAGTNTTVITTAAGTKATTGTAPPQPTVKPSPHKSTFDAASFIGGIVLVLGLQAVIFFLYKFCKSKEQNYHTL